MPREKEKGRELVEGALRESEGGRDRACGKSRLTWMLVAGRQCNSMDPAWPRVGDKYVVMLWLCLSLILCLCLSCEQAARACACLCEKRQQSSRAMANTRFCCVGTRGGRALTWQGGFRNRWQRCLAGGDFRLARASGGVYAPVGHCSIEL